MKMTISLCVLSLLLGPTCCRTAHAISADDAVVGKQHCEAILKAVAPQELASYKGQRALGYSRNTADLAIRLTRITHELWLNSLHDKQMTASRRSKLQLSRMFAWELAIQCWKGSKSMEAKTAILKEWDARLVDKPETELVVRALYDEFDRAFLTDAFVGLFNKTTSPTLIHTYCLVFGQYGKNSEETLLKDKLRALDESPDKATQEHKVRVSSIKLALAKIDGWKHGDTTRGGPATGLLSPN